MNLANCARVKGLTYPISINRVPEKGVVGATIEKRKATVSIMLAHLPEALLLYWPMNILLGVDSADHWCSVQGLCSTSRAGLLVGGSGPQEGINIVFWTGAAALFYNWYDTGTVWHGLCPCSGHSVLFLTHTPPLPPNPHSLIKPTHPPSPLFTRSLTIYPFGWLFDFHYFSAIHRII